MKHLNSVLLVLLAGAVLSPVSFAINASPHPFKEKQPDGTVIQLTIHGDKRFHWLEDTAGYTVLKTPDGFVYATKDKSGELAPSKLLVGRDDPEAAGLEQRMLPPEDTINKMRHRAVDMKAEGPERVDPLGTVKNLVVPIRFSNHAARTVPSQAGMDALFNAVGGDPTFAPTGSIRDLYYENSYGQMTLESTVLDWVDVPNSEQYYANGDSGDETLWEALKDALDEVDASIDFDDFDADGDNWIDAIAFLHSGYAAEFGGSDVDGVDYLDRIWSHRWTMSPSWTSDEGVRVGNYHISPALWGVSGSAIGRIGVIAHETGHFFGLPDLYDTTKPGSGIGSWGLMANSWGFDGSQFYPPHFCAWSKIFLGWTTPTVISTAGTYSIKQWALNNEVYRINYNFPSNEYLLMENRQPVGTESAIPLGGLVIYHIDDAAGLNTQGYPGQSGWPENGNHYRVAVLQADGQYHLEKETNRGDGADAYRAAGVNRIGPDTVPNTNAYQLGNVYETGIEISQISAPGETMTFRFSYGDDLDVTPEEEFSAGGVAGGPFAPASKTYTLNNIDASSHTWTAELQGNPAWASLDTAGGVIAGNTSVPIEVSIDQVEAAALPVGLYTDALIVTNVDSGWEFTVPITLEVAVYRFPMDTDPGWSTQGAWAFGAPTGGGGEFGSPDPTSGYTGANVYGYNLSGDYASSISPTQYLTTGPLNFNTYENVSLRFRRWLGVEAPQFDHAYLEVSNNNVDWTVVWENTEQVADSDWQQVTYDISAIADERATVYLRWGMGTTDGSWNFCGWNIDDVALFGDPVVVDCSEAPEIIRTGADNVLIECGGTYVDEGATALDNCDGELTEDIETVNPVNTAVPGVYTVTYNVSDGGGNPAVEVTRTVTVVDTTPPVITLNGDPSVTVECGSVYDDAGATAGDTCDGDLTLAMVVSNPVDTAVPGEYTITYDVMDSSNLAALQQTRLVTVVDTTPPVITLLGDPVVILECKGTYVDAGATALDGCDGDLTLGIVAVNPVVTTAPGEYTVTYDVSDGAGNDAAQVTRTVIVEDTGIPTIELVGSPSVTVPCSLPYNDLGALAMDACDGDLTDAVVSENQVDSQVAGVYTVTYNVSDDSGNAAIQVTRTVTVEDTIPPFIEVAGPLAVTVSCGAAYEDQGATADDACGGDLSSSIVVTNPVDTSVPGEYTVTYNVDDPSGLPATPKSRTVTVLDDCPLEDEGEGVIEGGVDGEGIIDIEGSQEGEGAVDGEGIVEGGIEGLIEGEGEGVFEGEGEGADEGEVEGNVEMESMSADPNGDFVISLPELLRIIQFFNALGLHCPDDPLATEDGFAPGLGAKLDCVAHDSDYNPQDWVISLSELLRMIQFYNNRGYYPCPLDATEDGFCAGSQE